jgi:hypothetical protein
MEISIEIFFYFILHPIALVIYSSVFFSFIFRMSESAKTVFFLECYCIFMISLAFGLFLRNRIYVRDIGIANLEIVLISYLIVSILILLFCFLSLEAKILSSTKNVYIYIALSLVALIIIFQHIFISFIFIATLRALSVCGCLAVALYGLWEYSLPGKEMTRAEKRQILSTVILFCLILATWMLYLNFRYEESYRIFFLDSI